MINIIIVINGEKQIINKIRQWFNCEQYKIMLVGLLPSSSELKSIKEERTCWHELFALQEEFKKFKYVVSIATEKGTVFNLINTIQAIDAEVLILPKAKFLTLATDEFEDFLTQLPCSLILY